MAQIQLLESRITIEQGSKDRSPSKLPPSPPEILTALLIRYYENIDVRVNLDELLKRNIEMDSDYLRNAPFGLVFSAIRRGSLKFKQSGNSFLRIVEATEPHVRFQKEKTNPLIASSIILPASRREDTSSAKPFEWFPPNHNLMTRYQWRIRSLFYELLSSNSPVVGMTKPLVLFLSGKLNGKDSDSSWRTLFGFQAHPNNIALIAGHIRDFALRNELDPIEQDSAQERASTSKRYLELLSRYLHEERRLSNVPLIFINGSGVYKTTEANGRQLIFRNYPRSYEPNPDSNIVIDPLIYVSQTQPNFISQSGDLRSLFIDI